MTINDVCALHAFMIWAGGEGGEELRDHKKKREKENTGLVGNYGTERWEKGAFEKDSEARCVRNVLAAAAAERRSERGEGRRGEGRGG